MPSLFGHRIQISKRCGSMVLCSSHGMPALLARPPAARSRYVCSAATCRAAYSRFGAAASCHGTSSSEGFLPYVRRDGITAHALGPVL